MLEAYTKMMKETVQCVYIPELKSTIALRNAYSTESNSSFSRLNNKSLTLIIFSSMLGSLGNAGDLWSSLHSLRSMWTAASVNNGDKGKELEHCATPSMNRSDHVLCSRTSWSVFSRLRNTWIPRVQSTVRNKRRVAISYTYSIDNEETPRVGVLSLNWRCSELMMQSYCSEGRNAGSDLWDKFDGEVLLGEIGWISGFSWWPGWVDRWWLGDRFAVLGWFSLMPLSILLVIGFLSHCTAIKTKTDNRLLRQSVD